MLNVSQDDVQQQGSQLRLFDGIDNRGYYLFGLKFVCLPFLWSLLCRL